MGGALVVGAPAPAFEDLAVALRRSRTLHGAVSSPMSSWLALRGLRTLPCRVAWQSRGALAIAEALAGSAAVERVHYPGLASHPQHALAARQLRGGFGGVVAFEVRGGRAAALRVVEHLELIRSATSLGGVETMIEHRRSIEGEASPTPDGLLRLSVGLEHPDDLIAALSRGLGA
jgi:cystathionine gamma-synthase